jgi:hypothetical protein
MNKYPRRGQAAGAEGTDRFQEKQFNTSAGLLQSNVSATAAVAPSSDEISRQSLRLILPERGPYAAMIIEPQGPKYNRFAATSEELWTIIKSADEAGYTAYHACASFREARNDPKNTPPAQRRLGRTKSNVLCAKSFWLDIDAGPEKPYSDWREARKALDEFCRKSGLPPPLVVLSGVGLHAYWPLQYSLPCATWERYALGLKALCKKLGLHADPARTTDISTVLRTPGTHHRKSGIRQVRCLGLVNPYQIEQFQILLDSGTESVNANQAFPWFDGKLPPYLSNSSGPLLKEKALSGFPPYEPSFGEIVAENCEQVRKLRKERGKLAEPVWYAALGVLAHCEDGDRLGHEWSSGDPRYTERETQERLDRAREFGPTTCTKFHDLNPTPCQRCPHWQKIKSPIHLGRAGERNSGDASQENCHQGSEQTDQHDHEANQKKSSQDDANLNPFPLNWHGDYHSTITRRWLVKHMIPETGVGLISGQWGTYKTFIAIDLAGAVMTGSPFASRPVKRRGGVLFLAAEGAGEIRIRLCGLVEAKFQSRTDKLPFAWVDGCPKLTENGAIHQLEGITKQAADHMRSEFRIELALIIVDTMSAAAGFTDENSSSEGQRTMNALAELSRRTGAFVMACDHFGKTVETGTRGTSAKEAAADVIIACLGDKDMAGNVTSKRIAIRKLRGGVTAAETPYVRRIVDLGFDQDNESITTCVIDWSPVTVSAPSQAAKGKGWPKTATVFRSALVTALKTCGKVHTPFAGDPPVRAVELEKVREEFDKRYPLDNDGDRKKQMDKRRQVFRRSRTDAEAKGLIGGREIEGKFMIWAVNAEDGALERQSPPASHGERDSSVTA